MAERLAKEARRLVQRLINERRIVTKHIADRVYKLLKQRKFDEAVDLVAEHEKEVADVNGS